jgi:predicted P-loop ATPase
MNPGCPYVATPILIGGQGIGKSASAKVLFGSDFVVDDLSHVLSKDDVSRAHCFFCTELSEVDGITNKSEKEAFKAFLTRCVDVYRPPYGTSNITKPRSFVFWGTSNSVPLNDPTGSRRFVAIDLRSLTKANPIPLAQIAQYRAAIWARAFEEYHSASSYELNDSEQTLVNAQNDLFTATDAWGDRLTRKLELDPRHTCLSLDDAFTILEIPPAQQTAANQKRLRETLESLGYQSAKVTLPDGRRLTRLTRQQGQKQVPVNVTNCTRIA